MSISISFDVDEIKECEDPSRVVPKGKINIRFNPDLIFSMHGDLILSFDVLLAESLRVILGSKSRGQIFDMYHIEIIGLTLAEDWQFQINVFENRQKFDSHISCFQTLIPSIEWLLEIAKSCRNFQEKPGIEREIVLRAKSGGLIALTDVMVSS